VCPFSTFVADTDRHCLSGVCPFSTFVADTDRYCYQVYVAHSTPFIGSNALSWCGLSINMHYFLFVIIYMHG
jgi:hypothetical protein